MLTLEVVSAEEVLPEVVLRLMSMSGAKETLDIKVMMLEFMSDSSLWREKKIPTRTRNMERKATEWWMGV